MNRCLLVFCWGDQPITLLLESAAAKDMSCLIAGYCRLVVDPNLNVFPWIDEAKKHRVSAEEGAEAKQSHKRRVKAWFPQQTAVACLSPGYVSRCGSDSDSSDLDVDPLGPQVSHQEKPRPRLRSSSDPEGRKRKDRRKKEGRKEGCQLEKSKEGEEGDGRRGREHPEVHIEVSNCESGGAEGQTGSEEEGGATEEHPPASEASDSCRSDSHGFTSPSSDSLDALEEDDFVSCSSSAVPPPAASHPHAPLQLHHHPHRHAQPHLLAPPPQHSHPLIQNAAPDRGGSGGGGSGPQRAAPVSPPPGPDCVRNSPAHLCSGDTSLRFADLSQLADLLPSPPEASEDDEVPDLGGGRKVPKEPDELAKTPAAPPSTSSLSSNADCVFNFERGDARCYYNLCSNITPDSARSLPRPQRHPADEWETGSGDLERIPILQPPPGFGDSSSDDEFFDARDRLTSPEDPTSGAKPRGDALSSDCPVAWCCPLLAEAGTRLSAAFIIRIMK